MIKEQTFLFVIVCTILVLVGSFFMIYIPIAQTNRYSKEILSFSAEKMIEEHVKWLNEKNYDRLIQTIPGDQNNADWQLNKIKFIKIIDIVETEDDSYNELIKEYSAVKIFKVTVEEEYKGDLDYLNGTHVCFFIMVKEDGSSP